MAVRQKSLDRTDETTTVTYGKTELSSKNNEAHVTERGRPDGAVEVGSDRFALVAAIEAETRWVAGSGVKQTPDRL